MAAKTALVTGASRGLGRALAQALARQGFEVVALARGEADLEAAVAAIRAEGGLAHALVADVGDPASAPAIAARVHALIGTPDVLIHDASTLGAVPLRLLADTWPDDLARTFEVNVLGPFRLTRALLGGMLLRESGFVVAISSDASVEAYPRWGGYGASKAALDHLVRVWAAELEGTGVRMISVDPGEMDTQMHADAIPDADRSTLADPVQVAARIVAMLERPPRSGARVTASQAEEAA
jgi:NAD(P)-dependent dehydrogenase (short-subunit alcohol dehydrogenase family)